MSPVKFLVAVAASLLLSFGVIHPAASQTAPPAPTLVAPGNGASLVQPITLDWNAVVDPDGPIGSYTWQVGTTSGFTTIDQDSFPTPLIVDQTIAASQFSTSTLPTKKMWWRVRANDASGNPGNWSTVRRFEVKN